MALRPLGFDSPTLHNTSQDEGHRCLKQASEVTADSGIVKCSLTFAIGADGLLTLTQVQCKETPDAKNKRQRLLIPYGRLNMGRTTGLLHF